MGQQELFYVCKNKLVSKIAYHQSCSSSLPNICNGIFHISFFKALLINEGETTRGETTHGIRGETTQIQGKLTPTAFRLVLSAGKLNLPLVPSQDYGLLQPPTYKYSDLGNLIGFQHVICQCNITMG
jgi:hypothetical protein